MRASIVIPALDEETNLARTLPVVFSQIGPADEVIVVDNGSSDGTVHVGKSLGAIVVREPSPGRAQSRNAGIKAARGGIVVFLDADCCPASGWLRHMLEGFDDETVGCVAGEIMNSEISTSFGKYLSNKGHLSQANTFNHPFLPYAQSGNVAYSRRVLDRIGGFDEALFAGHDADLCWRMQLNTGYKLILAHQAKVFHEFHLTARSFLRQKRRHALGAVLLYRKYRAYRDAERKPVKHLYWEYRSIARRVLIYSGKLALAKFRIRPKPPLEEGYQLLVEIGEKAGRIEGSLRYRALFL